MKFVPCPNRFRVKESFVEKKQNLTDDVFITRREDNDESVLQRLKVLTNHGD